MSLLFWYDILLYTIDLVLLTRLMDKVYGAFSLARIYRQAMTVTIALLSGMALWNSPLGGTYPCFSVIFSLIFLPFHRAALQKKILFSFVQLVSSGYLIMLSVALSRCLSFNFSYIGIQYYILQGLMHLAFWLFILAVRMQGGDKASPLLPRRLFGLVMAIPASSLAVLFFFTIRINNNTQTQFALELPLLSVFIFLNLLALSIHRICVETLQKNGEVLLLKQQLHLSERHFQEMSHQQDKMNALRHDMKNHLQSLFLMTDTEPPQTEDILTYIHGLLRDFERPTQFISTGNLGIDSVLSLKFSQIQEKHIQLKKKIAIPPGLPIPFEDSIIILGNILDNAMQACEKLEPGQQRIRLELRAMEQCLFIRVSNPMPDSGSSSKMNRPDFSGHGYGLKNVRTVVEKYNGFLSYPNLTKNQTDFTLKIVLYNIHDPKAG